MLSEYSWDMIGYKPKSVPSTPDGGITRYMAERIFRLEPEPPKAENLNDYILSALREKDLKYFSFFLHHYEQQLNKRIRSFLCTDGSDQYDPERFVDIKNCPAGNLCSKSCLNMTLKRVLNMPPTFTPSYGMPCSVSVWARNNGRILADQL